MAITVLDIQCSRHRHVVVARAPSLTLARVASVNKMTEVGMRPLNFVAPWHQRSAGFCPSQQLYHATANGERSCHPSIRTLHATFTASTIPAHLSLDVYRVRLCWARWSSLHKQRNEIELHRQIHRLISFHFTVATINLRLELFAANDYPLNTTSNLHHYHISSHESAPKAKTAREASVAEVAGELGISGEPFRSASSQSSCWCVASFLFGILSVERESSPCRKHV